MTCNPHLFSCGSCGSRLSQLGTIFGCASLQLKLELYGNSKLWPKSQMAIFSQPGQHYMFVQYILIHLHFTKEREWERLATKRPKHQSILTEMHWNVWHWFKAFLVPATFFSFIVHVWKLLVMVDLLWRLLGEWCVEPAVGHAFDLDLTRQMPLQTGLCGPWCLFHLNCTSFMVIIEFILQIKTASPCTIISIIEWYSIYSCIYLWMYLCIHLCTCMYIYEYSYVYIYVCITCVNLLKLCIVKLCRSYDHVLSRSGCAQKRTAQKPHKARQQAARLTPASDSNYKLMT